MAEMKRELKVGKIATKEIKAVALPSKFEAKLASSGKIIRPLPPDPIGHTNITLGPFHFDSTPEPRPRPRPNYYTLEFKDGLGRTEVLALSKIDCVIDNKTLYIPETKIKDAVAILNKDSIISNIKR